MNPYKTVNRKLLPMKIHFFLFMAAMACVLPFRTIFTKQLGISATAVSIIYFAAPVMKLVLNPICGVILDYFKKFRSTISVIMVLLALSHVAMIYVPRRTSNLENSYEKLEKKFSSELQYFCSNKSENIIRILSTLEFSNETNESRFTCAMVCSKPTYKLLEDNTSCTENIGVEYKASVFVDKCDMSIQLKNGQLSRFDKEESNSFIAHMIESSVIYSRIQSVFFDRNCSKFRSSASEDPEDSDNHQKLISLKILSRPESLQILNEGNKVISILHEYAIKYENKEWITNCSCNSILSCRARQCFSNFSSNQSDSVANNSKLKSNEDVESEYISVQFWAMFVLITTSNISFSAIFFMIDTVTYELLNEEKSKYGQQRLWGTIGWGMGATVGGCINQIVSTESGFIDYAPSMYLLAIILTIDLIPIYHLKVTDVKYSSHIWKDVCLLLSKSDILYSIVIVYSVGILSGFMWNFQFWFMEELGASQVLLGLSQLVECIFELPWFLVSGWVIHKIGHDNVNTITFLCFGFRYLAFALMYDPWMTLPASILQGPCFGLFYASLTMYAKNEAQPGTEATVQSLLHLCFEGIGVATGIILGGTGIDNLGSRMTFICGTIFSFVLFIINIIVTVLIFKSKKVKERTEKTELPNIEKKN